MPQKKYYTFNAYLKNKFGEKVYKVSLDAGFDCPNRDGRLAVGGCTYCDEGSRAPGIRPELSIQNQMAQGIERMKKRYRAKKFIAYFQAFTNTYDRVSVLRQRYHAALDFPDVVGLSVSTRPDTLSEGALNLLEDIKRHRDKEFEVWLELGLQTIHDQTHEKLNRWHTYKQFENALRKARQKPSLKICAHVILGLPGETVEQMTQTIQKVASLPIDGVKLHLLHVIKNTKLHQDYHRGTFKVFEEDAYIKLVCDCLEMLPPAMIIHRVTGEAEARKMIAPLWGLNKSRVLHKIDQELARRNSAQGAKFISPHAQKNDTLSA